VGKITVLIVDDSAVVRSLLTTILSAEPDIEVVGAAPNAALAMIKLEQTKPDVVTLDVELPDVSGLALLEQIRKRDARLPIIMFSSLTLRAGATTLDALALGATDYVTKPSGGTRQDAIDHVRRELIPKVRVLGRRGSGMIISAPKITPPPIPAVKPLENPPVEVVAIGCSTGGPNALATLFSGLPARAAVPVVIVQHMPPIFTKLLAERLTALGRMKVNEAQEGEVLRPGEAYIAPGGYHMKVVRRGTSYCVALDQGPTVNSCRPAVDVLFESLVPVFKEGILGVIMTGMGQDGLRGCRAIRAAGGQIIAQDEASSVVWGMPGFVAKANLADAVLGLDSLAPAIIGRLSRGKHGRDVVTSEEGQYVR
jgi:two-component system, chemotaxis family, protein-glutamate methylesterase/glutaminase